MEHTAAVIFARRIDAPPDALALAAALEGDGARSLALLHDAAPRRGGPGHARRSYVACDPDVALEGLDPFAAGVDPDPLVDPGAAFAWAPRWIGVLPYEAFRHLERPGWTPEERRPPPRFEGPLWLRYPAVIEVDHETGLAHALGPRLPDVLALAARIRRLAPGLAAARAALGAPVALDVREPEPPAQHAARVAAAQELIRAGDLYQVNLARRLDLELRGAPLALYARLADVSPSALGAFLALPGDRVVLSTSPELLLEARVDGRGVPPSAARPFTRLFTEPIKGSRPRGADALSDGALARALDGDPKEIAELTMILDVERHDLGRVASPGSVRILEPPHVATHPTIHHRQALLVAEVRPGVGREEVLRAMLPSGSVTGAPKVRAMEVIASLEADRRGLYTGGIGHFSQSGALTLSMAIRAVVFGREGGGFRGEYLTGGGIVADSDPAREVEETRWKAAALARAARRDP